MQKYIFFPKKFEYIGYEILFNSIKPKSDIIHKLKPCNALEENQSLYGFLNYFKDSILNYHNHIESISQGLSDSYIK